MTEAGALRLLLVDDDVGERDAVRRALAAAGIQAEIEEAESVAAAVARLRAGRFDCALLDDDLPGGDGVQILRHVREAGVSTPVIVLTAEGDDQAAVRRMKAGAADCLSRNAVSAERLGQSLRHALRVHAAEQEAGAAAAALSRYLRQLRMLADAAIAINSAQQPGPLSAVAKQARIVIGAHQAMVTLSVDDDPENANTCVSLSEKYAEYRSLITRIDPLGIGDTCPIEPRASSPRRTRRSSCSSRSSRRSRSRTCGSTRPRGRLQKRGSRSSRWSRTTCVIRSTRS